MSIKVSVVIPVYNPGPYIKPCVESLLAQTLPPDEYEVIFVDDGSTDDTPAYLDALAQEHPQVQAIHIPNSGWPGKPRNVGFDASKGEYVQYVDQDDHMAPDALRRLYEMGTANGSDIVIGKVASNFRGVPRTIFRGDRQKCTIYDFPLINSLTPHKMFRAEFLREHDIRYAEGKRRLEDQLFMVQTYFRAEVVSILSSYTCYFYSRRDDGKNAGSTRAIPAGYYGNLREVLDVVVANTEPGKFRDTLLRRFYRAEMLQRISEPAMIKYEDAYREDMLDQIEGLAHDFVTDGVHNGLPTFRRIRSTLLRQGKRAELLEFARRCAAVNASVRLDDLEWRDGKVVVTVSSQLVCGPEERPLLIARRGDRLVLDASFTQGLLPASEEFDVTDEIRGFSSEIVIRDRATAVEWPCRGDFDPVVEEVPAAEGGGAGICRVVIRGTAVLDPQATKTRPPLPKGMWDVSARVNGIGFGKLVRVGENRAPHLEDRCLPALVGRPAVVAVPYFTTRQHALTLSVDRSAKKLGPSMVPGDIRLVSGRGRTLELQLPIVTKPGTAASRATLVVRGETSTSAHSLPAELVPVGDRIHLRAPSRVPTSSSHAEAGTLVALLDGASGPEVLVGQVRISSSGRLLLEGVPSVDRQAARLARAAHRRADLRRVGRRLELRTVAMKVGVPVVEHLPPRARRIVHERARSLGL